MSEPDIDDELVTCWCGARGTYEELFADDFLEESCAGTGTVNCFCGGDLCVCHNHGEAACPGCEECDGDEDEHDEDPEATTADAAEERARREVECARQEWASADHPWKPEREAFVTGWLRGALSDAYREIECLRKQKEARS